MYSLYFTMRTCAVCALQYALNEWRKWGFGEHGELSRIIYSDGLLKAG